MGMKKALSGSLESLAAKSNFVPLSGETPIKGTPPVESQPESGATAAIERLSKPKLEKATTNPAYKARDYEAEAIGKTRCVQFEAALMSPAIAGMRFSDMKEYLALVREAADAGVAYSFQKNA